MLYVFMFFRSILRILMNFAREYFDSKKIVAMFICLVVAIAAFSTVFIYGFNKNRLLTKSRKVVSRHVIEYNKLSASTKAVIALLDKKDKEIAEMQKALGVKRNKVKNRQSAILSKLRMDLKEVKTMSASNLAKELTKLGY